jgi:hypothetical protein
LQVDQDTMLANQFGDLAVLAHPPAKMLKALAVISARAHQAYDECSGFPRGTSHDKCLFMSLAVRDFLVQIGFTDATVRSCCLLVRADDRQGKEIWSVGIGAPGQVPQPGKFNSHAVCAVPSQQLLIDTTVYQAVRPHWGGTVGGMAAINYHMPQAGCVLFGCPVIASAECELEDRVVGIAWLDRPEVQWKRDIDYREKSERRRFVTKALREAFGEWRDG